MEDKNTYNLGKALVIAPLIIPGLMTILPLLFGGGFNPLWITIILITMVTCYLATVIVGLPAFYLLNRFNCLNLITLTLSGIVLGIAFFTIILIPFNGLDDVLIQLLWGAILGFVTSLSFGLLAGVKVFNYGVDPERKY